MHNLGILLTVLIEVVLGDERWRGDTLAVWRDRDEGGDFLVLCASSWVRIGGEDYRSERSASGSWGFFLAHLQQRGFGNAVRSNRRSSW